MRRGFALLCACAFLAILLPGRARAISAASGILMNPDTGDVLWEEDADTPRSIASVTKLMTALVTVSRCDPDETVLIPEEAVGIEGSSVDLAAGETLTVRSLLYGLLLESGNDAAEALAIHVAGSEASFAVLMNETGRSLGCTGSTFRNPHGLTQEGHASTARDLARIMSAVLEDPLLCGIMRTRSYTAGDRVFLNHNRLLDLYEYATGGKTGYTQAAGRTLVSSAEKDGIRLICVTLDDDDDWEDHVTLYEAGFSRYRFVDVIPEGAAWQVPVISGTAGEVRVTGEAVRVALLDGQRVSAQTCLPRFVYAGVEAGAQAGFVSVSVEGSERVELPLYYAETVGPAPRPERSRAERAIRWLRILYLEFRDAVTGNGRVRDE